MSKQIPTILQKLRGCRASKICRRSIGEGRFCAGRVGRVAGTVLPNTDVTTGGCHSYTHTNRARLCHTSHSLLPCHQDWEPHLLKSCSEHRLHTMATEMFTRQIPQSLKWATVKITGIPSNPQYLLLGETRQTSHCFSEHTQRPLPVNLTKLPIRKWEKFEVGNGKNYRHLKKFNIKFAGFADASCPTPPRSEV